MSMWSSPRSWPCTQIRCASTSGGRLSLEALAERAGIGYWVSNNRENPLRERMTMARPQRRGIMLSQILFPALLVTLIFPVNFPAQAAPADIFVADLDAGGQP